MSLVRSAPWRRMLSVGVKYAGRRSPCVMRVRSELLACSDGVHDSQSVTLTVGVVTDSVGKLIETSPPNVSWRLPPRLTRLGPNAVEKFAFELIEDSAA